MHPLYLQQGTLASGAAFDFASLTGKVVLIVNTASKCTFTPQLRALTDLQARYQDQGFSVLAFPSNQFGHGEPRDDEALNAFYQKQFAVNFPVFSKTYVSGPKAHPIFNYLTAHTRGIAQNRAIKWNFTKYLLGRQGDVLNRYAPRTRPLGLAPIIESALAQSLVPCP